MTDDTKINHNDDIYCGVGLRYNPFFNTITSVSPDSDLFGLVNKGDKILAYRESGESWKPFYLPSHIHGPAGTFIEMQFEDPSGHIHEHRAMRKPFGIDRSKPEKPLVMKAQGTDGCNWLIGAIEDIDTVKETENLGHGLPSKIYHSERTVMRG